jgi:Na+/melibiose symporter-like transporter
MHPVRLQPFRNSRFRWLFAVFLLNGIAAAIPATLFLFFTNDRLALPQYAGLFLVLYFIAAALSMPLWVALAKRYGEQRAWLIGMALAIAAFVWAYTLGSGAVAGFAVICILSGFALGADLALPPALLAAVIGHANGIGKHEGSYFGIWNWATKMNLALAAGISLPLLEVLGYTTGTTDAQGLHALAIGYALLPCFLKTLAALLLWRAPLNHI